MKETIALLFAVIFTVVLLLYVNHQYDKCEAIGGAYIKGYCLDVKVLK
jgi:hypothetical protein